MPEVYQKFGAVVNTPMMAMDVISFSFPFDPFRKLLLAGDTPRTVSRKADKAVFWDELVSSISEAWKSQDVRTSTKFTRTGAYLTMARIDQISIQAYRMRSAAFTALANDPNFSFDFLASTTPACTSVGDMSRLGLLVRFRPSSGNKTLVVEDVELTPRSGTAGAVHSCWQYDGRFSLKLIRGSRFTTQENMDAHTRIMKDWYDAMILS